MGDRPTATPTSPGGSHRDGVGTAALLDRLPRTARPVVRRALRRHAALAAAGTVILATRGSSPAERATLAVIGVVAAAFAVGMAIVMVRTESWWLLAIIGPIVAGGVMTLVLLERRRTEVSLVGTRGACSLVSGRVTVIPWDEVELVRCGVLGAGVEPAATRPAPERGRRRRRILRIENAAGAAVVVHSSADERDDAFDLATNLADRVVLDQHALSARASFARGETIDLGAVSLSHAGLTVRPRSAPPQVFTWREVRGLDLSPDGRLLVERDEDWLPVAPAIDVDNLALLRAVAGEAIEYTHGRGTGRSFRST